MDEHHDKGGGGLVQQLRKSYSLSDLSACEPREERAKDEADDVLAEPRLIRRPVKSGFATRRSASESSRSPMYFPEVDVDVRGARRVDEPDFSHIKSTEDISSGYSSAENSSSLTRAASAGARSRRARTAVTAIKRPQAAEDDDVIEELQDDDSFDYSNMPPLHQFSSPLYLSHTDPPFIYQYVGDQVKIIQVIGNYPLNNNFNTRTNNTDIRDQKELVDKTSVEAECNLDIFSEKCNLNDIDIPINVEIKDNKVHITSENNNVISNTNNSTETDLDNPVDNNNHETNIIEKSNTINDSNVNAIENINDNPEEASSLDSIYKSLQKIAKGKYGKDKAPMPPYNNDLIDKLEDKSEIHENISNINKKEDVIVENVLQIPKETEFTPVTYLTKDNSLESEKTLITDESEAGLEFDSKSKLNLDYIDRSRHKSKSPVPKAISTFGKILHIPKLAFWHKTDKDNISNASDVSRKSSLDNLKDEYQSCSDLSNITMEYKSISNENDNYNGEIISNEKSDDLLKVREAKVEKNPEYKFIPLCEDLTASKSTDV